MILSSLELDSLAQNCVCNTSIRAQIGKALFTVIYDPLKAYSSKYKILGLPQTYDCPSPEILLLCAEYLQENYVNLLLEVKFL